MLHVDIIAVGNIRENFFRQACQEYLKRNSKYYQIKVIEIKEESFPINPSLKQIADGLEKEAVSISSQLKPNAFVIGLTPSGEKLDSIGFAQRFNEIPLKGFSNCTFVIGGSNGLSLDFLKRCHWQMSFSDLTFPHQLFRIILLEQLFRSAKINHHETYHK